MHPRTKLTILVSHPIQYQTPLFRFLTQKTDLDLRVLFMSDFSVRGYEDREFKRKVEWGSQILEGFNSEFLERIGPDHETHPFWPVTTNLIPKLREQTNVLLSIGYSQSNSVRALKFAHRNRITTMTRSDIVPFSAQGTGWKRKLKNIYVQKHFQRIDCFLASSSLNHKYYNQQGVPDEKIFMVPHAVDNDFFQSRDQKLRPERETLRQELGFTPNESVILWAHKLTKNKRVQDILQAHQRLQSRNGNSALLLVGDGEDRPLVEDWIKVNPDQKIRFLGFQDQEGMAKAFVMSDLFVMTSANDAFGLVLNEAMNAKLPVVVSDGVGAAPDLVIPDKTGAIYPTGDIEALTHVLTDLTADKARLHQLGENALAHINTWSFRENVTGIAAALRSKGHPIQTEFD